MITYNINTPIFTPLSTEFCSRIKRRCKHPDEINGTVVSSELNAYNKAKSRCNNPNVSNFADYGGRGIEFRLINFAEFLADVGRKPSPKHSLDRIDVNGHYEVGNMRWALPKEQCRNTRVNHLLTLNGQTLCVSEWAEILGIKRSTIAVRIGRGWCDTCALTIFPTLHNTKNVCTHSLLR